MPHTISSKAFRLLKYFRSLYLDWWCSSLLNNTSKWTDTRCDGCLTSDWHVLPKMQLTAPVQSLSWTPALSPLPICDVGTLHHTTDDGDSSYPKQFELTLKSWVVTLRFFHITVEARSHKSTHWFWNNTMGKCQEWQLKIKHEHT